MFRTPSAVVFAFSITVSWGLSVDAQTTRQASTRQTNQAFGASAQRTIAGTTARFGSAATGAGSSISQGVQGFSEGVPAIQQAQQLRDTAVRGQFVGAEARNAQQAFGANQTPTMQQRRPGGLNLRTGTIRQPGTQTGRISAYGRQAGTSLQPTINLGFQPPQPSSANVHRNVADAMVRVPGIREGASIAMRVEGGVVVLEGTVSDPHHRALAAQLVALEPGVSKVDNRLTVSPPGR